MTSSRRRLAYEGGSRRIPSNRLARTTSCACRGAPNRNVSLPRRQAAKKVVPESSLHRINPGFNIRPRESITWCVFPDKVLIDPLGLVVRDGLVSRALGLVRSRLARRVSLPSLGCLFGMRISCKSVPTRYQIWAKPPIGDITSVQVISSTSPVRI